MGNFYRAESECSKIFTQKCKLSTVNRALLSITQTCGNKKHSVSAATTPRVSRQARNPVTIPYCREMFMDLAFMKFWQCSKVTKNKLTHTHKKAKTKNKTKQVTCKCTNETKSTHYLCACAINFRWRWLLTWCLGLTSWGFSQINIIHSSLLKGKKDVFHLS